MEITITEIVASFFFLCSIVHTFLVTKFEKIALKFEKHSFRRELFHHLGEIEIVFGLWAFFFFLFLTFKNGFLVVDENHQVTGGAVHYILQQRFAEPVFVFVIMCITSTKPVLELGEKVIISIAKFLPLPQNIGIFSSLFVFGTLLGSIITEPAAMTICALILSKYYFEVSVSSSFKYAVLSILFICISIGGTLTNFAAPPVLVVAHKFHWDMSFMFFNFGYKAVISILVMTFLTVLIFKKDLMALKIPHHYEEDTMPLWPSLVHLFAMFLVVKIGHYPEMVLCVFVFFLGFVNMTKKYQDPIKIRSALLVAFFLAGLITLGSMQEWWVKKALLGMNGYLFYFGSILLTAIADNAALTYLGSLAGLSDDLNYFLVAGAVAGGGLTVIANAPNLVGLSILRHTFGRIGVNPFLLMIYAIIPTIITSIIFLFLPSL